MGSESKSFPVPGSGSVPQEKELPAADSYRGRLWLEVAIGYGFILAAIWTPDGPVKFAWMVVAALSIITFAFAENYSAREMGLGLPPMKGSLLIFALAIILASSIPALALISGENASPAPVHWHAAWQYLIWAVMQEFILQSFVYVRLATLLGSRKAVFSTAFLFALAHVPSPVLMLGTFVGGLFFCEMFRRYRSIYPIGIAHGLLGLTIAASFSSGILHHMRVGIGYLTYHSHHLS